MTMRITTILTLAIVGTMAIEGTRLEGQTASSDFEPDYARAAQFSSLSLMSKVLNGAPVPRWIGTEDRFWLTVQTAPGTHEFVIVDAATGAQSPAFDHAALAQALMAAGAPEMKVNALPIQNMEFTARGVRIQLASGSYHCALPRAACEDDSPIVSPYEIVAPDGKRVAFIRDHNIWLRDSADEERQLTRHGEEFFAYGSPGIFDNTRVTRRRTDTPKTVTGVAWSPDGRYLAALRTDKRVMPWRAQVVEHVPPDQNFSVVHMDRHAVAADNIVPPRTVELIDTETGSVVTAGIPPDQLQDFVSSHFTGASIWWNLNGREFYFDAGTRDGRTYRLFGVDMDTGMSRIIVEETEDYYYAFNPYDYGSPNFQVTADGTEAIWYSQRSGYGHLYLYDAKTGDLRNAITQGNWVVFDLVRVDEEARVVYFTAGGREPGRNPYYRHLYRVSFDGGEPELLTPEDANHSFTPTSFGFVAPSGSSVSPSGRYIADTYSTLERPPVLVVRTIDGREIAKVLEADASALYATGWRPPTRFVVKAADGTTDLYGAMFTPLEMDPSLKYAVVENTYPGPQGDWGPHGFIEGIVSGTTFNLQQTAELGFIGVAVDGRGTSRRSHAFRYAFAGTEDVYGAADHKAAIENLAKKYSFIDADRVGIVGGSFGGYGTARATLLFPDFFDVTVSHVGPHDMRYMASALTVDRFFGIPSETKPEEDNYTLISNTRLVDRLKGHLLLIYGEIDENVPLNNAMIMYDALIKADKNFDTIILPNTPHGTSTHPYAIRRQLEYFVEHLGGPR